MLLNEWRNDTIDDDDVIVTIPEAVVWHESSYC
jgi:hypothetical protein